MIRILVAGDGGTPTGNFVRSIRRSALQAHVIGMGANAFDICKSECDESFLIPYAREKDYLPVLKDLVQKTRPDLLCPLNDAEIEVISDHRDEIGAKTFLPSPETVTTCVNKWLSYQKWAEAGLSVPKTLLLKDPDDLKRAFAEMGPKLWIRAYEGAFGYGAVPTDDFDFAKVWIDAYKGWGNFTAAVCLSPQSVTWTSIWKDGDLIVAQGRKRLYWEFANRNLSGVTGITGTGVTVSDPRIDDLALKVIHAVDKRPNGIFSVDFTYDFDGVANPTEINIGRFFTTHEFFAAAGLNVVEIYLALALGLPLPKIPKKINPLPEGLAWVRGMDVKPVLTTMQSIEDRQRGLAAWRASLAEQGPR